MELQREFATTTIAGSLAARERASAWDGALWRAMGQAGLLGVCLPVEHGGGGRSAVALCDGLIGVAEASLDAGLAHAWVMHAVAGVLIARFGTLAQRSRLLPELARGERVAAFARLDGGVRARGSGWRIEGVARALNGPIADVLVIGGRLEDGGWASFVLERSAAGLRVGEREDNLGLRTAMIGELSFAGCELGSEALLGAAGSAEPLEQARRWERACLLAPWVGLLDELVRLAFVRGRGRSQSIRALLADMRIRVELCRRVQARAAWRLDRGGAALERELAVASTLLGDTVATLPHEAARAFAAGDRGDPIARMARDAAIANQLWEGPERARAALAATMFDYGACRS